MGFTLGKERDKRIRARDLFAARALNMNNGALNNAVKPSRRARLFKIIDNQRRQIFVEITLNICAQRSNIDIASRNHSRCILIIKQSQ